MTPPFAMQRQRGVALIVVMIFTIIFAILAATLSTESQMQERMAGNTRERDLAFQAAEAALADAQVRLTHASELLCNHAKVKSYPANDNSLSFWLTRFGDVDDTPCTDCFTPSSALPSGAGKVLYQPEFLVYRLPSETTAPNARHFIVTARGVGGTADALVVLQAGYTCNDATCPACNP